MPEFLIGVAGALGMAIAVAHGYLGDTLVVRQAASVPETAFRVMRAIMFLSAVYWFVAGAALTAASVLAPPEIASWLAWGGGALFLSGRGRKPMGDARRAFRLGASRARDASGLGRRRRPLTGRSALARAPFSARFRRAPHRGALRRAFSPPSRSLS
ncbi:MAG: hypothetical protein AAF322_11680 [Pseudomonadota bacterium]